MLLSQLCRWGVLDTAISDGLVVRLNLGLLGQVLLDKSKCVHWIPPVRVFIPFLRAVCVSLMWEMNVPFRVVLLATFRSNVSVVTNQLYLFYHIGHKEFSL